MRISSLNLNKRATTYIFISETSQPFSLESPEDFIKELVLGHRPSRSEMRSANVKASKQTLFA